jgi:hypothetical protein
MPAGRAEANPERIAVAGSARLGGVRFEPEKMEAGRAVVSVRMMAGVNGASPARNPLGLGRASAGAVSMRIPSRSPADDHGL